MPTTAVLKFTRFSHRSVSGRDVKADVEVCMVRSLVGPYVIMKDLNFCHLLWEAMAVNVMP